MRVFSAAAIVLCLAAAALAGHAHAQLLPVGMPALPTLPVGGRLPGDPLGIADSALRGTLETLRRVRIDELLQHERMRVDRDPAGEPVLRAEYLVTAPEPAVLDAVQRAGFDVVRHADEGRALGLDIVVLHDRRGRRAPRAMRDLQAAAPGAEFAYQHLFLPAGTAAAGTGDSVSMSPSSVRVGLIDGGVGTGIPALSAVDVHRFGCSGRVIADNHATAVAVRLAGGTHDTLYAADLWCGDRVGRATLGLVEALGWMARERVAVINVSLVGPDNPVLARAVQALIARGHIVVAAVGNDGPAAPPLYPASYPGVIGVSGVDTRLRVLPEAASGPQVDFSAPGIVDGRTRGTSFAAPVVAKLAAAVIRSPSPGAADDVARSLARHARDLGPPGRDPRYGVGYVESF